MKAFTLVVLLLFIYNLQAQDSSTVYSTSIPKINGGTINFGQYAGKKILIVNTASLDKEASQLTQLQTLYTQNVNKLIVVAVPTADFNNLEPEDDDKIFTTYSNTYGITFPIAKKSDVIGTGRANLFAWLTERNRNGIYNIKPQANFYKYLIDEEGKLIGVYSEKITPLSSTITEAINQ